MFENRERTIFRFIYPVRIQPWRSAWWDRALGRKTLTRPSAVFTTCHSLNITALRYLLFQSLENSYSMCVR